MWYQVTDGSRNFQAWVHTTSEENSLQTVTGLLDFSPLVVNSVFFVLQVRLMRWFSLESVLYLGLSTEGEHTVANPSDIQFFLKLNDQSC